MNKNHISYLIIAFICGTLFSFAQEETLIKKDKQHEFSYYVGFGMRMEHFAIDDGKSSLVNPTDLENNTEHQFPTYANLYHEIRYKQKFGMRFGVFLDERKTGDYLLNRYSLPDLVILDKNLDENIRTVSGTFSLYYIHKIHQNWDIHYQVDFIDQSTKLSDNVIVHQIKEGDFVAPLLEYEDYKIERNFFGLSTVFVYHNDAPVSLCLGAHLNTLVNQKVTKDIRYYDDYYLLQDVYGIDVYQDTDPEDFQRFHFALSVSVKIKVFGVNRLN